MPQNNAVAERLVQDVLEGTRTALVRAGLPPCFWEFACRHYCMAENLLPRRKSAEADGDRLSPWEKTHDSPFMGQLIPIGAKVIVKPAETRQEGTSDMEPTSLTGVFAGYEMAPGCKSSGIYMVWTFEEFADMYFSIKSPILSRRARRPHKTQVVALLDEGICFSFENRSRTG